MARCGGAAVPPPRSQLEAAVLGPRVVDGLGDLRRQCGSGGGGWEPRDRVAARAVGGGQRETRGALRTHVLGWRRILAVRSQEALAVNHGRLDGPAGTSRGWAGGGQAPLTLGGRQQDSAQPELLIPCWKARLLQHQSLPAASRAGSCCGRRPRCALGGGGIREHRLHPSRAAGITDVHCPRSWPGGGQGRRGCGPLQLKGAHGGQDCLRKASGAEQALRCDRYRRGDREELRGARRHVVARTGHADLFGETARLLLAHLRNYSRRLQRSPIIFLHL